MATEQYANNAQTTLNGAISSGDTSLTVVSAASFPSVPQFRIRIDSELLLVTAGAGTATWTVTRGIENTTAAAHSNGATVTQVLTAEGLQNLLPLTTKGDLLVHDGTDSVRLGVGANGQVLTADSTQATGTKWAASSSGLDINGLTAADPAFADEVPIYAVSAAANRKATVEKLGGFLTPSYCGGRLTLTTATPVTTSDVTAATTLYLTPFADNRISLFDGTRWKMFSFAELSIKLTDASQSGTRTNGSAVITGLTDTSKLVRGMEADGTGMHASAAIASIDSATQVTLTQNASSSGTSTVTFSLPSGKNLDVYAVEVSGAAVLRWSPAWTGDNTRSHALGDQDGKDNVNNAAINAADSNGIAAKTGLYLGTVRTTSTIGQTEDSFGGASQAGGKRYIWNAYNRVARHLGVIDTTDSWTYSTAGTPRQSNGASGNKVEFVQGLAGSLVEAIAICQAANSNSWTAFPGVGLDSTTVNSAKTFAGSGHSSAADVGVADYRGYPSAGYHYLAWLETPSGLSGGTTTSWTGDRGSQGLATGMQATIMA